MARRVKKVAKPKQLPAKQPAAKGGDRSAAKTGSTIFQKAEAGNRRLGKTKKG